MWKVTPKNLCEKKVNAVFDIVKNATVDEGLKDYKSLLELRLDRIRTKIMPFVILGYAAFLIVSYFRPTLEMNIVSWIYTFPGFFVFLFLFCLIVLPSDMFFILNYKRVSYAPFLSRVHAADSFDLQYVNQLLQCDKHAVKYVLTHYKYERDSFKFRCGIMTGSLEKVGVFSAIAAVMILAFALSRAPFGAELAKILPLIILILYYINLSAHVLLERVDRIIALLEFSAQ